MEFPRWADEKLSKDLSVLRSQGEGQHLEYKKVFPQNTQKLAKEIAAFATSNEGTILIGVSDSGDLKGLNDVSNQEDRDNLLKRLEGICRGTVKPAITPVAKFAIENELIVLVVNVPCGKQPVYYSSNIPYVRHITESRPAEPHEVLEIITEHLKNQDIRQGKNTTDASSQFYSNLAKIIGEALIYAEQAPDRNVNPWLDQWRTEFEYAAAELRELSAEDIAIEENIHETLKEIAISLDEAATLRLTLGCGADLTRLTDQAKERLIAIKQSKIDSIELSSDSLGLVKDTIIITGRKLQNLTNRAQDLVESGKIEDVQAEASGFGHELLRLAQYNINEIREGLSQELTTIARPLHLIETMRIYMDGGRSMQAIVAKVSEYSESLNNLIGQLQSEDDANN